MVQARFKYTSGLLVEYFDATLLAIGHHGTSRKTEPPTPIARPTDFNGPNVRLLMLLWDLYPSQEPSDCSVIGFYTLPRAAF
jgi:hypothetical protein